MASELARALFPVESANYRNEFCWFVIPDTAQKMKFAIKDFFSKCDQIRRKLRTWSHLLKKSLMENFFFFFCSVTIIGLM